jgi:hypothetical protein
LLKTIFPHIWNKISRFEFIQNGFKNIIINFLFPQKPIQDEDVLIPANPQSELIQKYLQTWQKF